jgi:hypothetical protein
MSPTRSRAAEGGVDRDALLAAFDAQIRRRPRADGPDDCVERADGVVRLVSGADGWSGITWSGLDGLDADAVIAAQIARFAGRDRAWEWKHYSHDHPADLTERLLAAGFTPEPAEALLVAEIAALSLDTPPPAGVELRPVVDRSGVDALVSLHAEVFGEADTGMGRALLAGIAREPATAAGVVAFAGATPISAARGVPCRHRFREPVGRRHPARLAAPGGVPRHRGVPGTPGGDAGVPLPPGRRDARQPPDPPAPRFRRARHHDPVHPPGLRGVVRECRTLAA